VQARITSGGEGYECGHALLVGTRIPVQARITSGGGDTSAGAHVRRHRTAP